MVLMSPLYLQKYKELNIYINNKANLIKIIHCYPVLYIHQIITVIE